MARRETPSRRRAAARASFPVDVADHGETFVVTADLPGLRTQDVDVSVRKDRVRIVADFGDDEGAYLRRERRRGGVSRVIRLPDAVDERRVSASYHDGLLRVTLRKRSQPRRVDVQ
ncbi:MAG: Hsp20/alpha crystallin family protein [Haloplanus sp.]